MCPDKRGKDISHNRNINFLRPNRRMWYEICASFRKFMSLRLGMCRKVDHCEPAWLIRDLLHTVTGKV